MIDDRRPEQRRADALVEVCDLALRTGDLPLNGGGEPPQLSITVRFEPLAAEIAAPAPDYLTTLITSDASSWSEAAGASEAFSGPEASTGPAQPPAPRRRPPQPPGAGGNSASAPSTTAPG